MGLVSLIVKSISQFGISKERILDIINTLIKNQLIISNNEQIDNPFYSLTLTGGYYINILCRRMVYVESVLFDTNIYNTDFYKILSNQTIAIEQEYSLTDRMILRKERIETYMDYLKMIENNMIDKKPKLEYLRIIDSIKDTVIHDCNRAISKTQRKQNGNR